MKILKIDKTKIPYEFQYEVNGVIWTLLIKEHSFSGVIRIDLIDENGIIKVADWTCRYGVPLFFPYMQDNNGNLNTTMPQCYFTFYSTDKKSYPITFDNLVVNVFLTVQDVI